MRVTAVEVPTRVLVFGMARADGTIDAAALYDVADACGQSSEQVRSCLRRLVTEGLLKRDGAGRQATFHSTAAGDELRIESLERHELALRQDRRGQGWDGRWHMAAFAVPEDHRPARDRLREQLIDAGGAAVNNGLYVSPRPWEDQVREVAEGLDVADHLTLAACDGLSVGGISRPRDLARVLWPMDALAASYEAFVAEHRHVVALLKGLRQRRGRISDRDFLPGALAMMVAFQQVFVQDPLLPPELLPRPWPGRAARDLLVTSRRLALPLRAEHERPALFAAAFDRLVDRAL
ncbi:MAG: PaaX family transcriptional regulator C-terminal domain-containing protein [Acidimicrobiales bacterium]